MRCLIIIPAYNESLSIESLINDIKSKAHYEDVVFDYIIINDGSRDNTKDICRLNNFNVATHAVNLGIGSAVQTGYMYAKNHNYDIAIQMDGDGQHLPEYLPALVQPILNGDADFVIGSRFMGLNSFRSSFARRMGIKLICFVIGCCVNQWVTDSTSGFRAVNKKGIALFSMSYAKDYPEPESIVRASVNGLRICEVPVEMRERMSGISSINFARSVYYIIKVTLALLITKLESRQLGYEGE
jgi:glycosyltransferase involved in cell wall biosynthesis